MSTLSDTDVSEIPPGPEADMLTVAASTTTPVAAVSTTGPCVDSRLIVSIADIAKSPCVALIVIPASPLKLMASPAWTLMSPLVARSPTEAP